MKETQLSFMLYYFILQEYGKTESSITMVTKEKYYRDKIGKVKTLSMREITVLNKMYKCRECQILRYSFLLTHFNIQLIDITYNNQRIQFCAVSHSKDLILFKQVLIFCLTLESHVNSYTFKLSMLSFQPPSTIFCAIQVPVKYSMPLIRVLWLQNRMEMTPSSG